MSPIASLATISMDCRDPRELATFYGNLLGLEVALEEPDWILLRDPSGGTAMSFQREVWYQPPTWPETAGELQKMMHLDLFVEDLDEATSRAVELGAELCAHQPQELVRVLLDPAGHPFCLFVEGG